MNETRGNARTKPKDFNKIKTIEDYRQLLRYYDNLEKNKREPLKEREMNSLKDSEKTNVDKITLVIYTKEPPKTKHQIYKFCLKLQKQGCAFCWQTKKL